MIAFGFCSLTIFLLHASLNFFVDVVTVPGSGGGATTEQDRVAATHAAAGGSSSHFSPPPKNARFVVEFHCLLL